MWSKIKVTVIHDDFSSEPFWIEPADVISMSMSGKLFCVTLRSLSAENGCSVSDKIIIRESPEELERLSMDQQREIMRAAHRMVN